jgi:hypothetical protein
MLGLVRDNIALSLLDTADIPTVYRTEIAPPSSGILKLGLASPSPCPWTSHQYQFDEIFLEPLARRPASAGERCCRLHHILQYLLEWCGRWNQALDRRALWLLPELPTAIRVSTCSLLLGMSQPPSPSHNNSDSSTVAS